ncbi:hypothetical protein V1509DRAFT_620187 [Lipomyces kononenkoae]
MHPRGRIVFRQSLATRTGLFLLCWIPVTACVPKLTWSEDPMIIMLNCSSRTLAQSQSTLPVVCAETCILGQVETRSRQLSM